MWHGETEGLKTSWRWRQFFRSLWIDVQVFGFPEDPTWSYYPKGTGSGGILPFPLLKIWQKYTGNGSHEDKGDHRNEMNDQLWSANRNKEDKNKTKLEMNWKLNNYFWQFSRKAVSCGLSHPTFHLPLCVSCQFDYLPWYMVVESEKTFKNPPFIFN